MKYLFWSVDTTIFNIFLAVENFQTTHLRSWNHPLLEARSRLLRGAKLAAVEAEERKDG